MSRGREVTYVTDLGYSDLRRSCPCRSGFRSPPNHPMLAPRSQIPVHGLPSVIGSALVKICANLLVPIQHECQSGQNSLIIV